MKKISFLASGRGSNFTSVVEAMRAGKIRAQDGTLITSNTTAGAIEKAREYQFPVEPLSWKELGGQFNFEKKVIEIFDSIGTDLIVCAGYMKILSANFVNHFEHRIINIHPALLPSFPGIHSQKQALDYGVKISGCTVHFIDAGVDTGPIIMQKAVEVLDDDTEDKLSARILRAEHEILTEAVRLFCEDKLKINGRRVIIES